MHNLCILKFDRYENLEGLKLDLDLLDDVREEEIRATQRRQKVAQNYNH